MQWNNLENVQKDAPKCGCFLAYTRENLLFQRYDTLEEVQTILKEKELLELHIFDSEKEYRAVQTASKRYPTGVIETVVCADKEDKEETQYCETVWVEPSLRKEAVEKVRVINEVSYDELGMLTITNYRLALERTER